MESTRRGFLHSAGLTGLGATALGTGKLLTGADRSSAATLSSAAEPAGAVPFYGAHQAGIATPAQNFLQFAALDMVSDTAADLRRLLRTWSEAAAQLALGRTIGPVQTGSKPAADTGEALGLTPSELTVTFGFGPSLFSDNGKDRFGLASRRPAPLIALPSFRGDALDAAISNGDLGIQVCANDPQVAFHAVHELIRLAHPIARPRWLLAGSGRTGNSRLQVIPRNLMGFKDGTSNIMVEDPGVLDKFVWASEPTSPAWMRGGSYLVARRIQIQLGQWDRTAVNAQQDTVGREKVAGTVLTNLPADAHILLASPPENGGQRILRRGYAYVDGLDQASGAPATGLMFLCYQNDPRRQFIAIQRRLAASDALSKFITHIGSAIFACPPGAKQGEFVGQGLLG